ncbi:LuxR C-terminal-related transcriptional regulator [Chloroflexota bacterium]
MDKNKIRVFVVSQHPMFRQGIEYSLSSVEDVEFSGATEANDEVLSAIDTSLPDVILVDIDGPSDSRLTLAHKIKQQSPNIGIIVLSSNLTDTQLFQALKAQAAAYLDKEITANQLVTIIRQVARGEHPINESLTTLPRVAERVFQEFQELYRQSAAGAFMSPLTTRETEILNYIAQGDLNKQIASKLGISEQTIKNHVTSILRKLNANARTEAVVLAIKQGLISIP